MSANHPRCPVCSDDLAGATVRCPRCETGYHADCWSFGGACAIYGCEKVAPRAAGPKDYPDQLPARDRLRGGVSGALLGVGMTMLAWPIVLVLMSRGSVRHDDLVMPGLAWAVCAAVLGFRTGWGVRGRIDRTRTLLHGILGPAVTAFYLAALGFAVVYFPFFLMFSLPAVLFAVPCALVSERFNDASFGDPATQRRLTLLAGAVLALGAFVSCGVYVTI